MKPRFFVDVDTQIDFCEPQGALFVAGAPAVIPNIKALVGHAIASDTLLLASADSHDFTAWEFAANGGPFPPHCVKGTPGWLKVAGTLPERAVFIPNVARGDRSLPKGAQSIVFEKEVYSMFANQEAEPMIDVLLANNGLARKDVEAIVFGIATDYCVKAAAIGLRERGFDVAVVTDAIAPVTPEGGELALAEMRGAGCRLITTARAIEEAREVTRRITLGAATGGAGAGGAAGSRRA